MNKKKYKIVPYDLANDIWIVKKKFLFFWITQPSFGAGTKTKMELLMKQNDTK
jgi:hypothetical protein